MPTLNKSFVIPTLKKSEIVFEESFIKIHKDQLQLEQQDPYTYYSLLTPLLAVVILAMTPQGEYILNEEYRHPTGKIILGFPGGYIDPGEDPLQAAARELKEETGFQATSFTQLGSAFPYAGFSRQKTFFIRALGATYVSPPQLESSEIIRSQLFTPLALDEAIKAGAEIDSSLCTALYFHQNNPI